MLNEDVLKEFIFDCQMRNSELCNLKVGDVQDTYIHIVRKDNKREFDRYKK